MLIGIDLGTTNSSCAVFDGREVLLIPNERGMRTTPSVVALAEDGEVLVGESAKNQAVLHADRTIRNAKRYMGTATELPFGPKVLRPEEALSYILRSLKKDAENYLGAEIFEAVITVPAYFSEPQRRATREAGRLAGLSVRRLLNEPTAAAIAWAWSFNRSFDFEANKAVQNILVYDLGGGTFDATVLAMKGGDCRVLATAGDNCLGGVDFDRLLLDEAVAALESELGLGALTGDPFLLQQAADLTERAKIELSARESASVVLPFAGRAGRSHPTWSIDRGHFESLIAAHIGRTLDLVEKAVGEAELRLGDVHRLVLSGGSSRIPLVRRRLAELFGREGESRVNPEELVAVGAAVYTALSSGNLSGFTVQDAVSRSFGLEIDGNEFIPLIGKNTPMPVTRSKAFTTVADDQRTVEIHVLQGESRRASDNLSMGRFILTGIRTGRKGEPRIEVEFSIDGDEILHVRAKDVDTGAAQGVTIAPGPGGFRPDSLRRLASLIARAREMAPDFSGDRILAGELSEALEEAERAQSAFDDPEPIGGSGWLPERAAEEAVLNLTALIAELEARKT